MKKAQYEQPGGSVDIALDPQAGSGALKPPMPARWLCAGRGCMGCHVCSPGSASAPSVLAVDPGPEISGWCVLTGGEVVDAAVVPNAELLEYLARPHFELNGTVMAMEMIASYGMAVGREVFETCVWIGRFMQAWHAPEAVRLTYRRDVKLHLCGTARAKDANVRLAILDLFPRTGGGAVPQVGTKKKPGPLHKVSTHVWPALGVALFTQRQIEMESTRACVPRT